MEDKELYTKQIKKNINIPNKKVTQVSKIERIGYNIANKVHKISVLTLVAFILGNIFYLGKKYNDYWKARRHPDLIFELEKHKKL